MFSRLVLFRRGKEFFSGYTVVEREIIYRSTVILTPFINNNQLVDAAGLKDFIAQVYREAKITPAEIDTGAVITTGEAARKENTAAIIEALAGDAGKFVCAAAGPNLEALLAAHGSGAVKHSLQHHQGHHETILNVDIGGGTSKIALVKGGRILETCAINVGSRLIAWDTEGVITRIEEAGARVAAALGLKVGIGQRLPGEAGILLSAKLAELLFEILLQKPLSDLARSLMITPELAYRGPIDTVVYSGGVAEFIYDEEARLFGDLGPWLGQAVQKNQQAWGVALGLPTERIRATVIGASQYTVQVSGNTIFLSDPQLLPLHNLPVIKLPPFPDPLTCREVADCVRKGFQLHDLGEGEQPAAIAVTWDQDPDCVRLHEFAAGMNMALPRSLAVGLPIVLVFDNDVG
ncbi:MAG: ethanolamine ammonia-lyase reactivating factor EutA, partial [Deltaproteobacteria bacterium]|nr:ethanolamine ammonia-lyase reactivating factor EutA [Deltaproteobacteria bacterium]